VTNSYRFENVDDDSDFSDSEIEKLEFLDTVIDQDTGQQVFSKEPLPSRSAFDNVILEILDTPVEDEILKFKSNVFFSDFKLFSDWFDEHSSIIEDIGLNCFPEGEAKFTQKHRNAFLLNLINTLIQMSLKKSQFSFWTDTIKTHKARHLDF
jgi:hypothetical protein